jgi:beta-glucanase (GH16 family)
MLEPFTGSVISTNPDDGRASGGFQYTYGVMEAKVYVPGADGVIANWPAVWADGQSWPQDGEDDIFEGLGGEACFHFHYGTSSDPQAAGGCDAALTPGWHTFASDWQPGSVTYYYDGQDVGSITTGITDSPMYLIIDNTTSAQGLSGPTEMDALQVSYVRVWQTA